MLFVKYRGVLGFMLLRLLLVFRAPTLVSFYVAFELSLIPIFLLIIGWGYQPERAPAAISLLLYTVFASTPLLVIVVWAIKAFITELGGNWTQPFTSQTSLATMLSLAAVLGFLVKFPIFGAHIWLPKAHVEAPVSGSILLAAILLKLGGYGLILLSSMANLQTSSAVITPLALLGGARVGVLTVRQTDIKTLVAYSSVAHMAFVIAALYTQTELGLKAAVAVIVAHAVASSGIFLTTFTLYRRTGSRNFLLSKSFLTFSPVLSLLVFVLARANIGAPPTINLFREALIVVCLGSSNHVTLAPVALLLGVAVAFSLIFFVSTQHGQLGALGTPATPLLPVEGLALCAHSLSTWVLALALALVL
jgi:NADH-ubiquinone oxidoreductase chain 4